MPQKMMYTEKDMQDMQQMYQEELQDRKNTSQGQVSAFGKVDDENLVKWQLELDNILERIDHLLRGHKLTFRQGNMMWEVPTDKSEVMFNDYGVNEILRILSMYLNRNTILSNYTEDQVELKAYDFGSEVNDLIMFKYESMGLNTVEKMMRYPMTVRELIDVVHSAYLRALKGGERESLREARSVTQTMPLASQITIPGQRTERGMLNPMRYVFGKYK